MLRLLQGFGRYVRPAWKSITHGYRQFLCFFLAMLICQSLFWLLVFSSATNDRSVYDTVKARYDYHFRVEGLNETGKARLRNAISKANETGAPYLLRYEENGKTHTAYVTVGEADVATKETDAAYRAFLDDVLLPLGITYTTDPGGESEGVCRVVRSPLMTAHEEYVRPNRILTLFPALLLLLVSTFLLAFLYRVRLEDRRFQFGIYMTFGADFKRLFRTAVSELLLLSALALIPSLLLSVGLLALIYLPKGIMLALPASQLLLLPVFHFASVFLAVYFPMKRLSKRMPAALIASEAYTGAVSSPKRSFRIFGKRFPRDYELYSLLRFRKQYLSVILAATFFSASFLSCFYVLSAYEAVAGGPVAEYVITAPEGASAEDVLSDSGYIVETLNSVPGVSYTHWNESAHASTRRGFMMLKAENCRAASAYTVSTSEHTNTEEYTKAKYEKYVEDGYRYATNAYSYTLFDREMIDFLTEHYEVEGDPYSILEGGNRIIVGDSLFNRSTFDFQPGDQILLCRFAPGVLPEGAAPLDDEAMLGAMLERFGIHFNVYTVAAVVHGYPSENRFPVGLNAADYRAFSGRDAAPEEISVYIERGLSAEGMTALDGQIRRELMLFTDSGYRIRETGRYLEATVDDTRCRTERTVLLAVLILLLSPLVWLFAEALFFAGREKEFGILSALGAFREDIRRIYLWSGCFLAVGGAIATLLGGLLLEYLLFAFCNYFLAGIGVLSGVRFVFTVPIGAMTVAVLFSAAFGFLSAYLPYLLRKRSREREVDPLVRAQSASFSETNDPSGNGR